MFDIISVGSSTCDVFCRTKFSELIKIVSTQKGKATRNLLAYPTGAKILIKDLEFTTGGGGTNSAVAFSRLGLKTAFLGKYGNDEHAKFISDDLKKEKVTDLAVKGKERSGYSIILDSIEHDRTILNFRGANNTLKYSEVPLKKLKTRWLYFGTMMKESFTTLEKLADYAQENNIKLCFNISEYLARKGQDYLKKILHKVDVLVLNKYEAGLLVGSGGIPSRFKRLAALGPKIIAITEGKEGSHAYDGKYIYSAKPHKIRVVETTGAGDAFASAFLAGIIKKNSIELAIKLGIANAESVITHHGAKNKLLIWDEALKAMRRRPTKVIKTKVERKLY